MHIFSVLILCGLLQFSLGDFVTYTPCGTFSDDPPFDSRPLPESYDVQEISWIVYSGGDVDEIRIVNDDVTVPPIYDATKDTKFLIHGWNSNRNTLVDVKDAYLDNQDVNVVIVDWQEGASRSLYPQSASNTQVVGACSAFVADRLGGASFHCSGHSLGAHACGYMGKNMNMERVTAMDPAGPLFEGFDNRVRVDVSDASFVDVLHTQAPLEPTVDSLGMRIAVGDVDFYPNKAGSQPGCATQLCDHSIAYDYMRASIDNRDCYPAYPCASDEDADAGQCDSCGIGECQFMGEPSRDNPGRGTYYLATTAAGNHCS